MTGMVFNIQRFSVNDGPGIRTTVFLKGCPLHCKWCHNPESISLSRQLVLRIDRCIHCGDCLNFCKNRAIRKNNGDFETLRGVCIECGDCIDICYAEAREIAGKEMSTEEVILEVERDVVFYEHSGGGATFSGGEPLLQHEFLFTLLQECRARKIHTAVDTTGMTSPLNLKRIADLVDLFLFDLKTLDEVKHREFTGVSNKQILSNLRLLSELGKRIIVRIPLIPGVNDNDDDVKASGAFVASLGTVNEIHVLPYHKTGVEKYRRLGVDYSMEETVPPTAADIDHVVAELQTHVPTVLIGG